MDKESTTDDSNSQGIDDIEVTMKEDAENDSNDSTDDQQTSDSTDDLTSNDDDDASSDTTDDDTSDKAPAFDTDLDDWAVKTGHEVPENDRERKLLQDLRDSRREFTSKRATKKSSTDLQKTMAEARKSSDSEDDADPLVKEVADLNVRLNTERTNRLQSEYFSEEGVTQEEATVMGEILKEKAEKDDIKAVEYLTDPDNIADWHDLAKIRMAKTTETDNTDVIEKARKEERERLAKISKSGGPTRSAKSTVPASKKNELDELWSTDD